MEITGIGDRRPIFMTGTRRSSKELCMKHLFFPFYPNEFPDNALCFESHFDIRQMLKVPTPSFFSMKRQ